LKIHYRYHYHYFIENKLKILQILEEIPTELNTLISYKNTTLEHSALLNALRNILIQFLINSNYSKLLAHTLNLGNIHEIHESIEIEIILINSILKTFLIWSSYSYTNFGNYRSNNGVNDNQENSYIPGQISGNPGQISGNSDNYQSDCLISMRYMTNEESVNDVHRFQTLIDVYKYSLKMLNIVSKTVNSNNSKKNSKFYEIFEIIILCLKIFNEFLLIPSPLEGMLICI
jgi:hypothetical protein